MQLLKVKGSVANKPSERVFSFKPLYFSWAVVFLVTEILIALFVHDKLVRPYLGDTFVVILIYCFMKSFLNTPVYATSFFTLGFSFFIEFLQYLNIVDKFQIKSEVLRTVLGTSFSWNDILAYTAGVAIIILAEKFRK